MKDAVKIKIDKFFKFDPDMIHLDFETVKDSSEDYDAWFGTENGDHSTYLYQFGMDGTGGIFALWDKNGIEESENPIVVYLGSEGETAVAAVNFDDFLCLLADNFVLFDLVFDGEKVHYSEIMDEEVHDEIEEDREKYRQWLTAEYGLSEIKSVKDVLSEVESTTDEFFNWVDARVE